MLDKLPERPIKRSLVGMEMEMMTLDNEGKIIHKADEIIKLTKIINKKCDIVKECTKNIVEFGVFPNVKVQNTGVNLLDNLADALEACERLDVRLLPLATYPGKFNPIIREDEKYNIQKKIFGEKRFEIAGRCVGFHYHYEMPKGVFDRKKKFIKEMVRSKNKEAMLHTYNLMIAADPVLTTFTQSSPFYQGKFYGKDSRLLWYRGGQKLNFMDGMYAKYQMLGGLQPYKQTGTDLIQTINRKWDKWDKITKKAGAPDNFMKIYKSKLIPMWNPVKVNAHGTLEQRGMDMNHPKYLLGVAVLMKFLLRAVTEDFIIVLPSDIGIDEPFKIEGNIMYVPPHTHVRNFLQYESAYKGYESKELRKYIKKFLRTSKSLMLEKYKPTVKKIIAQVNREKSTSDIIIKRAKKKGYGIDTELPNDVAAEIALKSCGNMLKEIEETRKNIEDLE